MNDLAQQVKYIEVDAEVRYWEDSYIDGQADEQGTIPLRQGNAWKPTIDLDSGKIVDWPGGLTADIHYKVCDQGEYWLLGTEKNRLAKWKDWYVPNNILCVYGNGYGDYIIFKIASDGSIFDWKRPPIDNEQWEFL